MKSQRNIKMAARQWQLRQAGRRRRAVGVGKAYRQRRLALREISAPRSISITRIKHQQKSASRQHRRRASLSRAPAMALKNQMRIEANNQ